MISKQSVIHAVCNANLGYEHVEGYGNVPILPDFFQIMNIINDLPEEDTPADEPSCACILAQDGTLLNLSCVTCFYTKDDEVWADTQSGQWLLGMYGDAITANAVLVYIFSSIKHGKKIISLADDEAGGAAGTAEGGRKP